MNNVYIKIAIISDIWKMHLFVGGLDNSSYPFKNKNNSGKH